MNNPNEIRFNGLICTFTENGEWIYKAIPLNPIKKKVVEKPQIKVVEKIEEEYKYLFEKTLINSVKDIARYLY